MGNAVTDNYYDSIGTVTYWWTHAIISDQTYKSILRNCNFTGDKASKACDDAVFYAMNHEFGDIDQYSIYTPTCTSLLSKNDTMTKHLRLKNTLLRRRVSGYDPCTESYAEKYFNRKDVQEAMHANTTRIPYKWTACRWWWWDICHIIYTLCPTLFYLPFNWLQIHVSIMMRDLRLHSFQYNEWCLKIVNKIFVGRNFQEQIIW